MRRSLFFILLFLALAVSAQEDLAKKYFNDGDFERSAALYEKLLDRQPGRMDFADGLVASWQQLEQYRKVEEFLKNKIRGRSAFPTLLVDLGYNYSLQGHPDQAHKYYQQALDRLRENPNLGYPLGHRFQQYSLLEQALQAYDLAMELNPQLDYTFQKARIYGEMADLPNMFSTYLEIIDRKPASSPNVLRALEGFIHKDPLHENNQVLRKLLLQRVQTTRDLLWNELLSWLFIQEGQYKLAFSQEKAIYKRGDGANMQRLQGLAGLARKNDQAGIAEQVYEFILKENIDPLTLLETRLDLLTLRLESGKEPDLEKIEKEYEALLAQYGYDTRTLQLILDYADFMAVHRKDYEYAISLLKQCDDLPLSRYAEASVKMALADVLVMDGKFNEALITYTQVQNRVKNDMLGQEARFRVARTSFHKGDFDWALVQLKVLRGSTSQLIANDAMQLSLLISDNSQEDSTHTALKKYATADLAAYRGEEPEAIRLLQDLLLEHKGESIEDEALFRQAQLLEKEGDYEKASLNYQKIIAFYADGILADDAHFALGELFRLVFDEPAKAMEHYEQILFNHEDSYYFPAARQQYRLLRGDNLN